VGFLNNRDDLLLEATITLDDSGAYTSDWVDTSGVTDIRVAFSFVTNLVGNSSVRTLEAMFDGGSILEGGAPVEIREQTELVVTSAPYYGYAQYSLTGRWFQNILQSEWHLLHDDS
jgi:hypothetical protein